MKALELIKALERLVDKYGDWPVEVHNVDGDQDFVRKACMVAHWSIDRKTIELTFLEP